eukprot:1142033-Pelagomonas_calceolata.AAC.8
MEALTMKYLHFEHYDAPFCNLLFTVRQEMQLTSMLGGEITWHLILLPPPSSPKGLAPCNIILGL